MTRHIRQRQTPLVDNPGFKMKMIIEPDKNRNKNSTGEKDGFIYLFVIRFYKTDDFLHFRKAK